MKYVKWFNELSKEDIALAGGKGANRGHPADVQKNPTVDPFMILVGIIRPLPRIHEQRYVSLHVLEYTAV